MTFFYNGFWLHFLCTTTLLWLASNFVDRHVPTYLFQKRSTVVLINYSISNLSSIKGNLILLFNISSYTIQFQNMLKSYFDKNTTTTQFQPRTAAKRLSQEKSKRKPIKNISQSYQIAWKKFATAATVLSRII